MAQLCAGAMYATRPSFHSNQLDAALGLTGFDTTLDRHGISGSEDWKSRLGSLIRLISSRGLSRILTCARDSNYAVQIAAPSANKGSTTSNGTS